MLILAAGAICATGIAVGRRGSLGALAGLRFRHPELLCVGLAVQVGAGLFSPDRRFIAVAISYGTVAAWLVYNAAHQRGSARRALAVLTFGWVLNVLPILVNKGMPVSRNALDSIGAPQTISVHQGHLFKHVLAGRHTLLAPLGDIIPVRPLATVISVGDIVILIGMAMMLAAAMRAGDGSRPAPRRAAPALAGAHHE